VKVYKNIYLIFLILIFFNTESTAQSFKEEQLRYPRVRKAFENNQIKFDSLFSTVDITYPPKKIYIRIFKFEQMLELWAKADNSEKYKLVEKFPMTAFSGKLGPKRAEGDMQIPEGFYHIDRFNPASNYHLSLRLDYPNNSDIIRKKGEKAGGDIFIHGSNVTIGCVPIGDSAIEILYAIAVDVKSKGQTEIPVHIFPFKFNTGIADSILASYDTSKAAILSFWKELASFYRYFEDNRKLPPIRISDDGKYVVPDQGAVDGDK
jgi:murein L,D-transpeptidase YafK